MDSNRAGHVGMVACLIIAILLDVVPRLCLGDSEAYLGTEIGGYLPEDRSWAYGLLASFITRMSRDLNTMVLLQVVVAWIGACLLAHALKHHFRLGPTAVFWAFAMLFCNPLSFYWARAYMTDTLAAVVFGLVAAVLLSARGMVFTTVCVFGLTLGLCALRSIYFPPMLAAFGLVALLSVLKAVRSAQSNRPDRHVHWQAALRYGGVSAAVLLAGGSYAVVNSRMLGQSDISMNHASTRFLLSSWSPLIGPGIAVLDVPRELKDRLYPPSYEGRNIQAFAPTGIVELLGAHFGGYQAAGPAYRALLRSAVTTRPFDFVMLMGRSWSDYINPERVLLYHRERRLTGTTSYMQPDTLSAAFIARLQGWGIWQRLAPQLPQAPSFGIAYLSRAGGYWSLVLSVHATLAVLFYLLLPSGSRNCTVLAMHLFAFFYIATVALTANELVTRYLIPLDVPLLFTAGALLRRRNTQQADTQPSRSTSAALTAK